MAQDAKKIRKPWVGQYAMAHRAAKITSKATGISQQMQESLAIVRKSASTQA
jgi:hypothetical protein